jgi:hypothetical protein
MSAAGPAGRDVVLTAAVVLVELLADVLLLPLEQAARASIAIAAMAAVLRTRDVLRPGSTVRISTPPGRTDGFAFTSCSVRHVMP